MHPNKISCISLASHCIFKMAAMTCCCENFINHFISQLILIKFVVLDLFLDFYFPLMLLNTAIKQACLCFFPLIFKSNFFYH